MRTPKEPPGNNSPQHVSLSQEGLQEVRENPASGSRTVPKNQSRRPLRRLLTIGGKVALAYLIVLGSMMWFENLLIFPTWHIPAGEWQPEGFTYVDVSFESSDGTRLHGWYFEHEDPQAHVLYCHGNAEDVAHLGGYMDELRDRYRVSVFAFDYRGYGQSEGRPNEAGIMADAHAAQVWLAERATIELDQIVLWGRSLGGAVAVQLAAKNGARAMILERTFTSLTDVAAYHYRWLPVRALLRNRFESIATIDQYRGPLLQSHGTNDEVVPFNLGKQLFSAASADPKTFVTIHGAAHNGPDSKEYYTELRRFLETIPFQQRKNEHAILLHDGADTGYERNDAGLREYRE